MIEDKQILVIDVGNTFIHWGIVQDGKLVGDYNRNLHSELSLLPWDEVKNKNYTVAIAGSIPHINDSAQEINSNYGIKFINIKTDTQKTIKNTYPTLGIDRVCNLIGALNSEKLLASETQLTGLSSIVVFDFGTATTATASDLKGNFLGGLIKTGFETELKALGTRTFTLPHVEIARECKISELNPLAISTDESMLQGVIIGQIAFVEYYLKLFEEKYKSKPKVVLTGGNASIVTRFFNKYDLSDPYLTLKGIYYAYVNSVPAKV
jgi:type III pantothenate kinase